MSDYTKEREQEYLNDPLVRKAQLGIEAQTFMESTIGRYIISRSEKEIDQCYMQLSSADPFAPAKIAHLQGRISAARAAVQWLAEAVNEGYAAEQGLRIQEEFE